MPENLPKRRGIYIHFTPSQRFFESHKRAESTIKRCASQIAESYFFDEHNVAFAQTELHACDLSTLARVHMYCQTKAVDSFMFAGWDYSLMTGVLLGIAKHRQLPAYDFSLPGSPLEWVLQKEIIVDFAVKQADWT